MPSARPVGSGFFPLDEELGLLPGRYSPRVREGIVRLATQVPFGQAARQCAWFLGVTPSEATVRRLTEAAGAAQVDRQAQAQARLEQLNAPAAVPGPAVQQVSVDGAMVPLVGGRWAEVRTVAVGTVLPSRPAVSGPPAVQTRDWSYFSRLADAATFTRAAGVELHQRGTPTAGVVVAPVDGSPWCQSFFDLHRPDAIRILDFAHAAAHLSAAARAIWGQGTEATTAWLDTWLARLKEGDPADVLEAVALLPVEQAADVGAATAARAATLAYLAARWEQIHYANWRVCGYPIGSGSIESANKLVVEARLKGSGMHWAVAHVNPMLALRNLSSNDRWTSEWPEVVAAQRRAVTQRRRQRRRAPVAAASPAAEVPITRPPPPISAPIPPPAAPLVQNGRPTALHPWKRRRVIDLPDRHRLPPYSKS